MGNCFKFLCKDHCWQKMTTNHFMLLCRCRVKLTGQIPERERACLRSGSPQRFVLPVWSGAQNIYSKCCCLYQCLLCMIYTFSSDVRHLSFLFFASQESATKRRCVKGSQKNSAPESSSADCGDSQTGGSRSKGSCIICECHRSPGRTRCSESPDLEGLEGKENKLQTRLEWDDCSRNCTGGKQDCGSLDIKDTSATIFPDDDSNQILPIEQFFGNLDVVPVR